MPAIRHALTVVCAGRHPLRPRRDVRADPARDPERLHLGDDRRLDAAVRGEHRHHQKAWSMLHTRWASRSRASSAPSARRTARRRTAATTIIYTDPDDAVVFVESTGVDSLAVAIGTCHGIYPASMKPELKLDLLKQIKDRVDIPLVLHGGSNNPDDEIAESVKLGINKINISSDIKVAYHKKMREVLADQSLREPLLIQPPCIAAMKADRRTEDRPVRHRRQSIAVLTWPRVSCWD